MQWFSGIAEQQGVGAALVLFLPYLASFGGTVSAALDQRLVTTLGLGTRLTIFAPTDQAFKVYLSQYPVDMKIVLLDHIIPTWLVPSTLVQSRVGYPVSDCERGQHGLILKMLWDTSTGARSHLHNAFI